MALSTVIAINAAADALLLGGLAWMMSHPRKLKPHVPAEPNSLKLVETLYAYSAQEQEQDRDRRRAA
jgi:hypothetical protein